MAQQPEFSTHFFEYGIEASLWCSHWIGINSIRMLKAVTSMGQWKPQMDQLKVTWVLPVASVKVRKRSQEREQVQKAHFSKRRLIC